MNVFKKSTTILKMTYLQCDYRWQNTGRERRHAHWRTNPNTIKSIIFSTNLLHKVSIG